MAGAASFPAVVFSLLGAATLFAGSASASWHAQVFEVGGEPRGWRKPTAPNEESYNHWAARIRFHVGDFLHFKYDKNDSVLVVNRDAYQLCATDKPALRRFEGGDTRLRLDHSGFCYFISGAPAHCDAGQRMTLRVMVPQQQDGGGKPAAPARAPAAMSPGGEDDDEGGAFDPPPGARSSSPPGSSSASGSASSRPPPHVAPGAEGNKTSAAGSMHDAASSSSSSVRGHRVLVGMFALAALLLLLPD